MSDKPVFCDIITLRTIIQNRRAAANYEHYNDKIAICRDRIDTWKFIDNQIRDLVRKLKDCWVDTIEKVEIDKNDILNMEFTTGYDQENGTSHTLVCDAAYLFLSLDEAKADWDNLWAGIEHDHNQMRAAQEKDERYKQFLKLKQEFEPDQA